MKKRPYATLLLIVIAGLLVPSVANARLEQFAGVWRNTDADTRGLTQLNIRTSGDTVTVQAWGQCHPDDCDWGRVQAYAYGPNVSADIRNTALSISAEYRSSFKKSLLIIRRSGADLLEVIVFTRFTDESNRSNFMNTYRFRRADTTPAPAPTPSLSEDCIGFNWQNIEVKKINGRWKIVEGGHWIMDFEGNSQEARQALRILKHYRITQQCFVGRPNPSMTYILSGGNAPSGGLSGEDCISFNPDRIQVKKQNNRWKIVEGNHWIMDFGANQSEARKSLQIIRKYNFSKTCYVGRPDPSMSYFRR
jgi:hypothetical protein